MFRHSKSGEGDYPFVGSDFLKKARKWAFLMLLQHGAVKADRTRACPVPFHPVGEKLIDKIDDVRLDAEVPVERA